MASWNQLSRSWVSPSEAEDVKDKKDVLYTNYIISNDTQEALRIGQANTGESVLILPRQIHQYAWKCIGDHNQVQVCMEGSRSVTSSSPPKNRSGIGIHRFGPIWTFKIQNFDLKTQKFDKFWHQNTKF